MGNRRWKKREQGSQRKNTEFRTLVQKFERRSPSSGPSFVSVPNWEKRFCSQIKWRDFCNSKRIIHIFPNVLDWDDSAGKEAFDNAKARYWAKLNNLPLDVPLPDPNMYIQEVDYDAYIDPSLLEDLYKSPPPPPESLDLSSIKITPTGWDVVDPSPTANIPKFIFTRPSTAEDIVDSSALIRPTGWGDIDNKNCKFGITDESIAIIPTGWGEENDSEMIFNAQDSPVRQLNGASTRNNTEKNVKNMLGNAENRCGDWKQDWRNDAMLSTIAFSSWGRHEHGNGAPWDKRNRRRGGDGSCSSNHANLRCHEQGGYHKDRWTKYIKEQYFWRQKSLLVRGLSCTPENH